MKLLRLNKIVRNSVLLAGLLLCTSAFALESHLGYTRTNPPPQGYWYSDVPGCYNPWTDDQQMTLLQFPAANTNIHRIRDIIIEPEGWDMWWYNRVDGPQPRKVWEFVDLSTRNHLLTGTNWVHGLGYAYPTNSWVLEFTDEGSFDSWRLPGEYAFNLSDYRGIAVEVSNLGDTYLMFNSFMNKWLGKGHQAMIGLAPGETDILYHPFRRHADKLPPEIVDYFGYNHPLCGYPGGQLFESVYSGMNDAEGPWKIRAFVPDGVKKGNVRWSLNRMWAGGKFELPTIEEVTDPEYGTDPEKGGDGPHWTDDYGQWRHDDWTGKLWSDADCTNQYAELRKYLSRNPGPKTWNKWGGWEAGPQLEATGWFRVEKYPPPPSNTNEVDNSRWWFVDPDGRLFLSQGSLHMSANMPYPARIAGYDQDRFSEEVYFPRLRSMGLNTCGGNSSWKWHKDKMPYTYQIKTGWGPITEDDFLNGGDVAFSNYVAKLVRSAKKYAADPHCIGFIIDNELNFKGGKRFQKTSWPASISAPAAPRSTIFLPKSAARRC